MKQDEAKEKGRKSPNGTKGEERGKATRNRDTREAISNENNGETEPEGIHTRQENTNRREEENNTDEQKDGDKGTQDFVDKREERWNTHYGDKIGKKENDEEETIRVGTYNINTFPKLGSIKSRRLRDEMKEFDCAGMSEINKNWYKVNAQDSFRRRINEWWPIHKTRHTWMKDREWKSEFQQGGVSLTVTKNLSNYSQDRGEDTMGLARWTWQKLEGQSRTKTVLIQIYRPVKNTKDYGSTYMQQRATLGVMDPIQKFDEDIMDMIDKFIEDEYQIIIMGDFNITLNGKSVIEKELNSRGIRDPIQERYGRSRAPNTHIRGSVAIDGIFVSETIHMTRGGYKEGMSEISDHRMVWADFTKDTVLGIDRGEMVRPRGKKLQLSNTRRTEKFNRTLKTQMRNHKVLEKSRKLEELIGSQTSMTDTQARKYEEIYEQRERATKHAEEKCAKLPNTDDPFSPELQQALGLSVIAQAMVKKHTQKKRIHARWLIKQKERWQIKKRIEIPTSLEEAKQYSNMVHSEYRNVQKNSPELRSQFLDSLIQEAIDIGNDKKARDLRAIKEREQTRDVHARIKLARGLLKGGGVRFIHREDEQGNISTIKDKYDMEHEIMQANEEKLHAANESPIRQGELAKIITDHDYSKWEDFLQGSVEIPDGLEEGTRKWLEKFKGLAPRHQDIQIIKEEYIKGWNRVKEHTSCAPGALHFGTFKASRWCDEAAEVHTILARIPIATGYTPAKWTNSVDSMLPKKTGEWRAHKLRLTSLLRPDYNHNNKILGRLAMKRAEKTNRLAPEQYGSRKRLSAEKHALNKRLTVDILRVQKRPGIICANDAKACYDRILHFAAYTALRGAGLSPEAVKSMLEPIRRMKHQVRTAYGDSKDYYGGEDWDRSPSGICQGNGAGPAIWALVSSPLLDIVREAGYGAKLKSALGETELHLAGFAFVDDADTIQTGDLGESTESLLRKAQAQLDLWESGIRTTGGGISAEKTDFSILNYKWANGRWKYEEMSRNNKMTVKNTKDGRDNLKQLKVTTARRTLGVWQALDGNERKETKKLKEKANEWSRAVAKSTLGRMDTITGLKTSLYPSVTYGLTATTLTKEQCKEIFRPIRARALSKAGYNKTIPAIVVHAPEKFGGLGMMDFHTYQHIQHIKALIDDGGIDNPTGKLLDILIQDHTLETGRTGKILHQDYKQVRPTLTQSWISNTMEFLTQHKITIEYEQQELQLWRKQDSFIMDDIANMQGVTTTPDEVEAVNRCRLYLRVNTKSDISNGNGTAVLESARTCYRDWESISCRAYNWPYQPRPDRRDIETWQKKIFQAYGTDSYCKLWNRPLGKWLEQGKEHARWMYDRASLSVYERRGTRWHRWATLIKRTRTRQYEEREDAGTATHPRWQIAQVTTSPSGRTAFFEGSDGQHEDEYETMNDDGTECIISHVPSLESRIETMDASLRWALEHTELPTDNGKEIALRIEQGTAECISDGSKKDGLGTAASLFMHSKRDSAYAVCIRIPGAGEDQSSYRSELGGILSNILMINIIAELHEVQTGKVTIACDNENALWKSFGDETATTNDDSFDIIRVIHHAIKNSRIQWEPKHVRGHQDREKGVKLDRWAKANIAVDEAAGKYWDSHYAAGERHRPTPPLMKGEGWRVSIDERPIVKSIQQQIYERVYYKQSMEYWRTKGRFLPGMDTMVDWKKYDGAIKMMPPGKKQWVKKHFCGFEGTNQMLSRQGKRLNPYCPKCDKIETYRHILRCQSNDATVAYRQAKDTIIQWLNQTTSPGIKDAVLEHIRAYREEERIDEGDNWSDEVLRVSRIQEAIGPNAFVEGCFTDCWEEVQNIHLKALHSRRSASRWTKELIKKVWMVSWDMWDTRNGWIHREAAGRKEQLSAQIDDELDKTYRLGKAVIQFYPRADQILFEKDIQELKKMTDYQKSAWIHSAKKTFERDRKTVAQDDERQRMREYLKPGSTRYVERNRTRILRSIEDDDEDRIERTKESRD